MKPYLFLTLALFCAQLSFAQNNRSSSEVFIQIEDRGNFTVYLNDEFIGSSNRKFRFYNVYNSTANLSILQGDKKILTKQIQVKPNERLILNFSLRQGLKVIKSLSMYLNGEYALDDFDNYIRSSNAGNGSGDNDFNAFMVQLKREAFDDDKLKLILLQAPYLRITTAQASIVLSSFFKDENKLTAIKSLMRSLVDPQNSYLLKDAFTFNSGKEEFLSYLKSQASANTKGWSRRDFEQLLYNVKQESFDDNRNKLIQAALAYGSPSTAQVSELLKTYTADDKTLSIAKLLYPYVTDPHRYFTLKDNFKFLSNREAFVGFLAGR